MIALSVEVGGRRYGPSYGLWNRTCKAADLPNAQTVAKRFETWSRAIQEAGLDVRRAGMRLPEPGEPSRNGANDAEMLKRWASKWPVSDPEEEWEREWERRRHKEITDFDFSRDDQGNLVVRITTTVRFL